MMRLNTIKPAQGAKKVAMRVGRGPGSGKGKTCGSGHKGQKARAGGYHKVGFEGGQMPLQRRLPKVGFRSRKALFREEIRHSDLAKVTDGVVNMASLLSANLINANTQSVKIMLNGELSVAVTIAKEIPLTKGARAAIEAAGGSVEA